MSTWELSANKHERGGRGGGRAEDMAQDRELVDLLWAMEQVRSSTLKLSSDDVFQETSARCRAVEPSGAATQPLVKLSDLYREARM